MGLVLLAVIAIAAIAAAFLFKPQTPQQDMSPASLDSFNVTQASEGSVISVIYGRVRRPGNIIWYGNLETVALTEEVGKGGGSTVTTGYQYYLDIWQALSMGKVSIVKTYIQDNEETVQAASTDFNDGTDSFFPTAPGEYATRLKGVAHIYYDRMFLGANVTFVPTVHFVLERDLTSSPVSFATLTKGHNPAAIIYDLHILAGASASDMNLTLFNTAATYWNSVDYGLNIDFSSQSRLRDKIAQIKNYVEFSYSVDNNNKYYIIAHDPADSSVDTMVREDFLEFTFTRRSWNQTKNDFRANYIDEEQDFSKRTLVVRNVANIDLTGKKQQQSLDLSGFRDRTLASKRLWEIMKKSSYPEAQIKCTTNMKFANVLVGQVVEINNSDYGISSAEFRVITKDVSEIDQNKIGFEMVQMVETLFDDNFETAGLSSWVVPDYSPDAATYVRVFEMPYNPITQHERAFLLLAARKNSWETGFIAMTSNTGTDYVQQGDFQGWSQRGTLAAQYDSTAAYAIDDDADGILYTPYRDDPEFASLSRTDLFSRNRYVIINNEVMRFQTITLVGGSQIRLTGIIGGRFNTTPAVHTIGTEIWICELSNNIMTGVSSDDFYVKLLPYFGGTTVDIALVSPVQVVPVDKSRTPWAPVRVVVTRSGTSCTAVWWPTNQDTPGAGAASADSQVDSDPMLFDQDFDTRYNGANDLVVANTTRAYTQAGSHTFSVQARQSGFVSGYVDVTVGASDGDYYGGW